MQSMTVKTSSEFCRIKRRFYGDSILEISGPGRVIVIRDFFITVLLGRNKILFMRCVVLIIIFILQMMRLCRLLLIITHLSSKVRVNVDEIYETLIDTLDAVTCAWRMMVSL